MNTTERKIESHENIIDINNNSIKTYFGCNSTYIEFLSSLKSKIIKYKK